MARKFMDATIEQKVIQSVERCGFKVRKGGKKAGETTKLLHCMLDRPSGEEVLFISRESYVRDKRKLLVILRPAFSVAQEHSLKSIPGVEVHYPEPKQREYHHSNLQSAYQNEHLADGHSEAFGHAWLVSIEQGLDALAEFMISVAWSKVP